MVNLRQLISGDRPTVGTFLSLGSSTAAEACAIAGFDWVLVDLEHGAGDEGTMMAQVHAASRYGVPTAVRVETAVRIRAGRALDLGADGIMFPRLDTAAEVAEAVRHFRYPPLGDRGMATYHPAAGFGLKPETLLPENEDVVGIIQIETVAALENVDSIAQVPGVDILFVGPRDLAGSLGLGSDFNSPVYQNALDTVSAAAQAHGKKAGILAANPAAAIDFMQRGFSFVAIGSDASFVAATSRDVVTQVKQGMAVRVA